VLHGLTNKIDPGPPTPGNAGERYDPDLPFRPRRALQMMLESDGLKSYLGADYVKTYVACKLAELDKFEAIVSPAEYEWYL
jgi:glutamine synthetase